MPLWEKWFHEREEPIWGSWETVTHAAIASLIKMILQKRRMHLNLKSSNTNDTFLVTEFWKYVWIYSFTFWTPSHDQKGPIK